MKEMFWYIFTILILVGGSFTLGWYGKIIYSDYNYEKRYEGLRFVGNNSHQLALETAQSYDPSGDWVCSNVRGMSYQRCVEVAQHECGHEVFAEILEKNPEKIDKVMEVLNETG